MFDPPIHPATLEADALLKQCRITRGRASGPGGQHRNKVETAVELVHEPTGIRAHADERRSQEENRKRAVKRLRHRLAAEFRRAWQGELPMTSYQPTELWRERAKSGRVVCSEKHHVFPELVAEAMDVVGAHHFEPKPAAAVLGISSSQLLKLIGRSKQAWTALQGRRQELGLKGLKAPGR